MRKVIGEDKDQSFRSLCKTTLLMCSVCAVKRSTIKGQAQQKQREESIERAIHRQLRHLRGFSGCRRAGSPLLATRAPFFCRKEVICGRWDNERKRCAASAELPVSAMPHASHETWRILVNSGVWWKTVKGSETNRALRVFRGRDKHSIWNRRTCWALQDVPPKAGIRKLKEAEARCIHMISDVCYVSRCFRSSSLQSRLSLLKHIAWSLISKMFQRLTFQRPFAIARCWKFFPGQPNTKSSDPSLQMSSLVLRLQCGQFWLADVAHESLQEAFANNFHQSPFHEPFWSCQVSPSEVTWSDCARNTVRHSETYWDILRHLPGLVCTGWRWKPSLMECPSCEVLIQCDSKILLLQWLALPYGIIQ